MAQTDTKKTVLIFRKWRGNGDIIAIFPEMVGTTSAWTCWSYQHIGQGGTFGLLSMECTKPAEESEYRELLAEITAQGFNPVVRRRITPAMHEARHAQLDANLKASAWAAVAANEASQEQDDDEETTYYLDSEGNLRDSNSDMEDSE